MFKTAKINPLAQISGGFLLIIPIFLSSTSWQPIYMLAMGSSLLAIWLRPSFKKMIRFIWPFFLISAGLFIVHLLFSQSEQSLHRASAIFFRTLSLSILSMMIVISMDPLSLVRALMQQLKLSSRWGYAIFAALNMIPILRQDLKNIQQTRTIRYAGCKTPIKETLTLPVMLLASAIRRANRTAFAMASRELEKATCERTFLIKSHWKTKDTLFLVSCFLLSVTSLIACLAA